MNYQKIFVAGHRGMVGSALIRKLQSSPNPPAEILTRTRDQLDLCDQAAVDDFFATEKPDCVLFAAAKVGGIHANATYPAEFGYENTAMAMNSIHSAYRHQTKRFLFLGSTCIYPRNAPQPIPEDSLLTSPLEQTNEAYALAKIMGLKLCQYYRQQYGVMFHSAMPTNLYGPGDNYHSENSHVIPGLIRRFHDAKLSGAESVTVWGSGNPRREFLHVDDLATGVLHLIQLSDPPDWVNVGTGTDLRIADLAQKIATVVGFQGKILQDTSKPDGTPVKRTNTDLINSTGWTPKIDLDQGLQSTYADFVANQETIRC
ncbi:GDP-L-fucose synthase family protein [Rhodopirellula sallentina]|uniref:GDP-L-fucose synthase n=1 Tax=Rhodopirellula sallentina SM41 TaxID=1263870 RepID=M5U973_9BACT|nr:GDP-L-fucose synthase [Rhodopirellula sallentina]EMI52528.1 NAD-dependent epimerase/dehydratase [Rhodopirellula sallentina SM41]